MSFDFTTLITDRTQADFERWKYLRDKGFAKMTESERTEWLADDLKGAYHKGDLNRVGEALNYLRDRLAAAGYITYQTDFTARTTWTVSSIPTADDLACYLRSVSNIREALSQFKTTPPAPTYTGTLSIDEANNIEKILIDVDELITKMQAIRYFGGDIYGGEI